MFMYQYLLLPTHSTIIFFRPGRGLLTKRVESRCGAVALGSVSTSRSSNRTCAFNASGSRTELHAFAHGRFCGIFGSCMSPNLL